MADKFLTPAEEAANHALVKFVRVWLKFRRTTQSALAAHLEVSDATVSKWLAGKQGLTVSQFARIASFLGCTPDELMADPAARTRSARFERLAAQVQNLPEAELDALTTIAAGLAAKAAARSA